MRTILVLLVGLVLVGCSSNNIAKNKTTISNMSDFLKVNEAVCSKYRSTDSKIYGCGTSTSKSFELAKSIALLQAKVVVSDSLSNSLIKNEADYATILLLKLIGTKLQKELLNVERQIYD